MYLFAVFLTRPLVCVIIPLLMCKNYYFGSQTEGILLVNQKEGTCIYAQCTYGANEMPSLDSLNGAESTCNDICKGSAQA